MSKLWEDEKKRTGESEISVSGSRAWSVQGSSLVSRQINIQDALSGPIRANRKINSDDFLFQLRSFFTRKVMQHLTRPLSREYASLIKKQTERNFRSHTEEFDELSQLAPLAFKCFELFYCSLIGLLEIFLCSKVAFFAMFPMIAWALMD